MDPSPHLGCWLATQNQAAGAAAPSQRGLFVNHKRDFLTFAPDIGLLHLRPSSSPFGLHTAFPSLSQHNLRYSPLPPFIPFFSSARHSAITIQTQKAATTNTQAYKRGTKPKHRSKLLKRHTVNQTGPAKTSYLAVMAPSEYASMKVPELKKLLGERGLVQSGNKADLIARLQENDSAQQSKPAAAEGNARRLLASWIFLFCRLPILSIDIWPFSSFASSDSSLRERHRTAQNCYVLLPPIARLGAPSSSTSVDDARRPIPSIFHIDLPCRFSSGPKFSDSRTPIFFLPDQPTT